MKAYVLWGLVAVVTISTGYTWLRTSQVAERAFYCSEACGMARECNFLLPERCEARCQLGKREVLLGGTCSEFKQEVDTKGYLF